MIAPHEHGCRRCGGTWLCTAPVKAKQRRCIVDVAAAANQSGPFCARCLRLIMAERLRELPPRFTGIQ